MGKKSRQKGRRAEYEIRDLARVAGYTADRVPLSGASEGFKGDVRVMDKHGKIQYVEAKIRASAFKTIYQELDSIPPFVCGHSGALMQITRSFKASFDGPSADAHFVSLPGSQGIVRIEALKPLLAGSDILAIRADRQPWIFIRYLS